MEHKNKVRAIAFYLPQFYPTKENDEWWGKGFTEWTNVGKAKPLFKGHYQPKVPADLGYYDLRVAETREEQAKMAREAGIEGFCYWHYWFAGRRLLDQVFNAVLESGKPDYPFCLCWANHSWYAKTWRTDIKDKLLIEQTYPGEQDYIDHFNAVLPAFLDKRYIKVGNKPIFGLYAASDVPDIGQFINLWNKLAQENGFDGIYFISFTYDPYSAKNLVSTGINNVVIDYIKETFKGRSFLKKLNQKILTIFGYPYLLSYDEYTNTLLKKHDSFKEYIPCVLPNFDHSPRSGSLGIVLTNTTPEKWKYLLEKVLEPNRGKNGEENILFIKAWNEWAEGNYLEPDLKFGKKYLEVLKHILS
ncbi:glycosyltransferase WbsX family protein [Viscerimonas tarda]